MRRFRRQRTEDTLAALKRQVRREHGLRVAEAEALLRLLHGETLTHEQRKQAARGAKVLIRQERERARMVLATFRGDKALRDDPEFEPSGCYVDDRPSIRAADLVNADDLTADVRRVLGAVL